jgi:5-methylcytosine-specific restriction endonuclease McrA
MSPTRLCGRPGCPNPAVTRGKCREHATQARKLTRSSNDAFYSSKAWHITRRRQLFEHPLCQYHLDDGTECGEVADSVHHITPIENGGAKRDPANLMSVCRPHHTAIHRAMAGGRVA